MYSTESAAIQEIRSCIRGYFKHRPLIYFLDYSITITVGYFFAYLYFATTTKFEIQLLAYFIAGFAIFRAGLFMHEIVHMPSGKMRPFKVFWNLTYGLPLGSHSYLYTCHLYHHQSKTFGTIRDGEYLPIGRDSKWRILFYLLQVPLIPIIALIRFTILAPLSYILPAVRSWMVRNLSSAVMNPKFKFENPRLYDKWWAICDLIVAMWVWSIVILFMNGVIPGEYVLKTYFLLMLVIGFNWFRNLVAHTYTGDGSQSTHIRQYLDSITIKGSTPVVELFFPVGMRYHALHHLFPSLPYHEMGRAHRKLKAELPPSSPYLANPELTLLNALWCLLCRSGKPAIWHNT